MSETDLIRKLSSREKRRLQTFGMLPVDAVDPSCSIRHLIEKHDVKFLYRDSGGLIGANPLYNDRRRNLFSSLRGSDSINLISLGAHSVSSSIFLLFHSPERIRIRGRRSIISDASAIDEQSFSFEPILVVGWFALCFRSSKRR
jgi:hypothetical protein